MKHIATLVLALVASTAVAIEDPNAADLQRMQGDWMVAAMKTEGMDTDPAEAQALFRTIEGNKYTVARYRKAIGQGTFAIDATKSPKTIDSTPAAPPGVKPILGIYEFEGEKLRVCIAKPGQPRPKNFDAKPYTGHTLIVWEPEVK
jgi:uncharacterized protein (TIGR03067 family)